jgi:hypothetical protein
MCKALADRIGCDLRTVDRALYEYGRYLLNQKKKAAALGDEIMKKRLLAAVAK